MKYGDKIKCINNNEYMFKSGDKVRFAGTNGIVQKILSYGAVSVLFENDSGKTGLLYFDSQGKLFDVLEDTLVLMERPKKSKDVALGM